MALKIELVRSINGTPPIFLIINNSKIFPILEIEYDGILKEKKPDAELKKPIHMIKGIIRFYDFFGKSHVINYNEIDEDPEIDWNHRINSTKNFLLKNGKYIDNDITKTWHPKHWNEIPEEDWPDWMKN